MLFGHLVQGRAPVCVLALLIGEQVGEQELAVPARLVVGDLSVFQELDQRGPETSRFSAGTGSAA
jgi:hypothetical protein